MNCPSCGAEVRLKSKVSAYAVCSFCRSMLVRQDLNLETIGQVAEIPDEMSVLQLGTRGKYNNVAFELVGRVKVMWEMGYWSEWFCGFEDGRTGWLGEAQGFYMMNFNIEKTDRLPDSSIIKIDQLFHFPDGDYTVNDIKKATVVGVEGELPYKSLSGEESVSVDLMGPNNAYACIEYPKTSNPRIFVGKYVDFDNLKLIDLKVLPGWENVR